MIRAINKANWHLLHDLEILPISNGFLIPSGTRAGVVHRIDVLRRCTCEAQGVCWHVQAIQVIEEAQIYTILVGDRLAAARRQRQREAEEAMNELYV